MLGVPSGAGVCAVGWGGSWRERALGVAAKGDDADAAAVECFVGDEECGAVGRGGEIAGAGVVALRDDVRGGVALERAVERKKGDAVVGEPDGEGAGVGD